MKQSVQLQRVWDFILELSLNNNKVWFDSHKDFYKSALADFQAFTQQMIDSISQFDSDVAGLSVKDCTYRIYRDLRFSQDKTPYKSHIGAYVCPHGKKSGYAGYYFHIEPGATNMLVSGLYMPTPAMIKSVREEIMCNGKSFDAAIQKCTNFSLDWEGALKKVPTDWNPQDEFSDYYRLKNYNVIQPLTKEQIVDNHFFDYLISEFEKTYPLVKILNNCVLYALENF